MKRNRNRFTTEVDTEELSHIEMVGTLLYQLTKSSVRALTITAVEKIE